MAKKNFIGIIKATIEAEEFHGLGSSDTVSYLDADGSVTASLANPTINTGWAQGDTYFGVENLTGTQYKDLLIGDNNANILDGGGSADTIYAGGGNDTVLGGGGSDLLYGEGGNDLMDGQWQRDTMYGGDGADRMWGGTNDDVLFGDGGNDVLHGDARTASEYFVDLGLTPGADQLHGGSGNDLLNGDGGNDLLWGDAGADTFQFDAPSTVTGAYNTQVQITPGDDVVKEFHGSEGDKLDFGGQGYSVGATTTGDAYITLTDHGTVTGHVTLEGVSASSFDAGWVIPHA